MQKSVRVVLLPLFLCSLFSIISTLYTSLALSDSALSSPLAISNSVVAPKMRCSKPHLHFLEPTYSRSKGIHSRVFQARR
ncbi:hypothetical protein RchiOBHm_Chr2g0153411 [Rosa chinensis]|uniref:Uncharacterized protein n=1 Tax=Rosa chinensis TaxID=74649 RepID=A0A2P6S0P3_ROSCH|nr:hypothetical protein RchiOBHm_Chr2g0153411 [Rosa chinensis]